MLGGSIVPTLRLPRWTHFYVIAAVEPVRRELGRATEPRDHERVAGGELSEHARWNWALPRALVVAARGPGCVFGPWQPRQSPLPVSRTIAALSLP
jgi:hypothetical protein